MDIWEREIKRLVLDFGNPFPLDGYLDQPRYSRESFYPSLKQCTLPSLRSEWGRGNVEGTGGEKEMGTGIGI